MVHKKSHEDKLTFSQMMKAFVARLKKNFETHDYGSDFNG